jgi:regulator of sigma E protease
VSWFLAALGFMVLIVLHELGHFTAAKLVGMRVERFALFFPPLLVRKQIGETEYAIGSLPLGGYVKITGMSPAEDLPEEVRTRAYHAQPVWKRVVVIFAGPLVNLVLGFVLLVVFFSAIGQHDPARGNAIGSVQKGYPAQDVLHVGDRVVAVNGKPGTPDQLRKIVTQDRCPGTLTDGCKGAEPLSVTVVRDGKRVTERITPQYDAKQKPPLMRLGFSYDPNSGPRDPLPFGESISRSGTAFWNISKQTVSIPAKIIDKKQREQIHGIVGNYEVTRQTILNDPADVVGVMAIISLALALVNLFPFLPLDGGHIFWAVVEKVRRKPVSYRTMEKSGLIGFGLVMVLFVIGLTNDIGVLRGDGFGPP